MLSGFAVFGCPSCGLPIAGTFGLLFSTSTLPLFGFELKIIALLFLLGTFFWLLRRLKATLPGTLEAAGHARKSLTS